MVNSNRPRLDGQATAGWGLLLVPTLLLLSRPLRSVDLWWDLARGREVVAGTLRPAASLLTLDNASEAAWLGGVPFFELWSLGGIFALAAVPLLVGLWLGRTVLRAATSALTAIVVLPLLLVAIRSDLEPTSGLFDLLGLLATWLVLNRCRSPRACLWGLGLVFFVWANLGPRPIWGLLLAAVWPGPVPGRGRAVLAAFLAGLFTPRGPLMWLDAATLLAPSAFVPSANLLDPRWHSILAGGWTLPAVAGGVVWGLAAVRLAGDPVARRSFAGWTMLAVPLATALLAQHNIAPAALWTVLWWVSLEAGGAPQGEKAPAPRWVRLAVVAMAGLMVVDACGALGPGSTPMGWGLDQSIDPRLTQIDDLLPGNEPVPAWCGDARSAGIAMWSSRKVRLVDHPTRALLGGRAQRHAELRRDLLWTHQWRYRRDDNSWGGWAHVLRDWRIAMLLAPAEDAGFHGALLDTSWKLIKLDSPTVPYASAETPRFDAAIVDVMRQQGLVDAGAWQPTLDIYDPQGWRVEVTTLLGLLPSAEPAVRQAGFFRAIQLPMAAVRSLAPLRVAGGSRDVRAEFVRCQAALAKQEWTNAGQVSQLRKLVLRSSPALNDDRAAPWLVVDDGLPVDSTWSTCLALYLDGQPLEAAAALTGDSAEEHYARGLLWIEAGEIEQAGIAFRAAAAGDDPGVRITATLWLEQVAPGNHDSTVQTR